MTEIQNPYFIAIGPTKTGTTWLYQMLRRHPQIEMPWVKELNYFFVKQEMGEGIGLRKLLLGDHWLTERHRRVVKTRLKYRLKELKQGKIKKEKIQFELRYFLSRQSDDWYLSLFHKHKKAGDISPMYSLLTEANVEQMAHLLGPRKLIISLRDPIQRGISHARMVLMQNQDFDYRNNIDKDEMRSFVSANYQWRANDYVELVSCWQRHFPSSQVLLYFYDELKENPKKLYERICHFLEIEYSEIPEIHQAVNVGIKKDLPQELKDIIIEKNLPFIIKMQDFFDAPYPATWLERYQKA